MDETPTAIPAKDNLDLMSIDALQRKVMAMEETFHKLDQADMRSRKASDGGGLTYREQSEWEQQAMPLDHPWRTFIRMKFLLRQKKMERALTRRREY